ncbi:MAG: hypothetical protein JW839_17975 [Candidatus Lokiarchaeota archaeon]|nr:hypothetical protein [Candidatus Lokiarchaeota archaeon]
MERELRLAGVLDALGLEWQDPVKTFDDRLVMQKMIYLLAVLDCDLGYDFNWYKYGPYSPDLTRDAYSLQAMDAAARLPIPLLAPEKIARLKDLVAEINGQSTSLGRIDLLELCASIIYLGRQFRYSDAALKHILLNRKPKFEQSASTIDATLSILRANGIIN